MCLKPLRLDSFIISNKKTNLRVELSHVICAPRVVIQISGEGGVQRVGPQKQVNDHIVYQSKIQITQKVHYYLF